jgi:predicted ATPase
MQDPPLEIRLLGVPDVWIHGERWRGPRSYKEWWLLAILVLEGERGVHRRKLARWLWPDAVYDERRAAYLNKSVTVLRKALGSEKGRLTSRAGVLRLDTNAALVDLRQFGEAVENRDLAAAASVHRGPLLESLREQEIGDELLARVSWERTFCLMRLEALRGDPPAVRRAFQEHCRRLDALGTAELRQPPPEHSLACEELVERATAHASTGNPSTVDLGAAAREQPRYASNLPLPLSTLVGRDGAIRKARRMLGSARLLTLAGTGGVGKTRLAIEVARELADEESEPYPDGIWFVDLSPLTDAARLPQALAAALGLREGAGADLLISLETYLHERRLLVVLDNCEHLLAAGDQEGCALLVDRLLRSSPGLRILATSRRSLGVSGERVWRVPPLALPPETSGALTDRSTSEGRVSLSGGPPGPGVRASVAALQDYDATRLFVERALLADSNWAATEENAPAVAEICRLLDGLPLAIELAAARVSALSVEEIAAQLKSARRARSDVLSGTREPARHQSLRACLDWSYDLLSSAQQQVLRRLSVFAGGCTVQACEAVLSGSGIKVREVVGLLSNLVESSLLGRNGGRETRYWLLETVRTYAAARLIESGEAVTARRRHQEYFLRMAEEAAPELTGTNAANWLNRLQAEHANLRSALRATRAETARAPALRMVCALWRFWQIRGHLTEGRHWLEATLNAGARGACSQEEDEEPTMCEALTAEALLAAGTLAQSQGDLRAAEAHYEASLAIWERIGCERHLASIYNSLGWLASNRADPERSERLHNQALAVAESAGDNERSATALTSLAALARADGDYPRARSLCEQALARRRASGNRLGIAAALRGLAWTALAMGSCEHAEALIREAMAIFVDTGHRTDVAGCLTCLGLIAEHRGDLRRARGFQERYLQAAEELGHRQGAAMAQLCLGRLAAKGGETSQAAAFYEESLSYWRDWPADVLPPDYVEATASLAAAAGRAEAATRLFAAAAGLRQRIRLAPQAREQAEIASQIQSLRRMLDERRFSDASARGQAMDKAQAMGVVAQLLSSLRGTA